MPPVKVDTDRERCRRRRLPNQAVFVMPPENADTPPITIPVPPAEIVPELLMPPEKVETAPVIGC